ncbi:hypothetical protein OG455_00190 [Kitasatospora sp. NBC_01287]|uniref:hypothetical protein n=1 Tax=Kitasatospora sp. NBC_01287 TaxID=2903573 RepID=UPI002253C055|nr:hypothetical protein [Kitasatospora sp. NBC_01287]MCX4743945.1 hypothetical protein [Kitasatospora sp. NBC_01287]
MSDDQGQGYSATEALDNRSIKSRGKRFLGGVVLTLLVLGIAVAAVGAVVVVDWLAFRIAMWLGSVLVFIEAIVCLYWRGQMPAQSRAERKRRKSRSL